MATADETDALGRPADGWRLRLYRVIWQSDTPAGRLFDQIVIVAIILSVGIVIADSAQGWHVSYRTFFVTTEWFFTLLFTLEYGARLATS